MGECLLNQSNRVQVECRRPTRWPAERVKKELQGWGENTFLNLRQGILQTSNITFIFQALFSNSYKFKPFTCPFQQKYWKASFLTSNWNKYFYPRSAFNIESKYNYKNPCLIVHIHRSVINSVFCSVCCRTTSVIAKICPKNTCFLSNWIDWIMSWIINEVIFALKLTKIMPM